MTQDARFEEGGERPLNLGALDAEDLSVLSALVQDAVFPVAEMRWQPARRRFGLLVNRFRWEDVDAAGRAATPGGAGAARCWSIENVLAVASKGIDRSDGDTVLSVLSVAFEPGEAPGGHVVLTLAGDGAIRAEVEALEVSLRDVTRPYVAPSRKVPRHPD